MLSFAKRNIKSENYQYQIIFHQENLLKPAHKGLYFSNSLDSFVTHRRKALIALSISSIVYFQLGLVYRPE